METIALFPHQSFPPRTPVFFSFFLRGIFSHRHLLSDDADLLFESILSMVASICLILLSSEKSPSAILLFPQRLFAYLVFSGHPGWAIPPPPTPGRSPQVPRKISFSSGHSDREENRCSFLPEPFFPSRNSAMGTPGNLPLLVNWYW